MKTPFELTVKALVTDTRNRCNVHPYMDCSADVRVTNRTFVVGDTCLSGLGMLLSEYDNERHRKHVRNQAEPVA